LGGLLLRRHLLDGLFESIGYFVLPGLIDCHSHLFSAEDGSDDTTAQMSEAERMKVGEKHAREYLEAGVTTVRNLGYGING